MTVHNSLLGEKRKARIKPWHSDFEKNCLLKKGFTTLTKAERFCQDFERRHGKRLRAYKCKYCPGYHTASVKE